VVVTLSAVDPDTEEGLADSTSQIVWSPQRAVKIDGTILSGNAGRSEQFVDPLVEWPVFRQLFSQPCVEFVGTPFTQQASVD